MATSETSGTWTKAFEQHVGSGDLGQAIACLEDRRTKHANTAPQAVKDRALKLIRRVFVADPQRLYQVALALAGGKSPTAKEIGIFLLPPFYETDSARVEQEFVRVGNDDNWEVREWAASALAHVIDGHFDVVLPRLFEWVANTEPNVRRMVVVAGGYAMRECSDGQCSELLAVFKAVMSDPDPYVSKNLGPFALGSYAVRYRPERVRDWAASLDVENEQTAWNMAMMFTTAAGAKHLNVLADLLVPLMLDRRRRVSSAVKRAVRQLQRRDEQGLVQVLKSWNSGKATQPAADALRGILVAVAHHRDDISPPQL